jgi:uncharacterized phosphatase
LTKICLIRHGETNWNKEGKLQGREDIVLNTYGEKQALYTAQSLNQMNWNVIISSPLKRALKTAEIIKDHLILDEIIVMEEFIERDYGEISGLTKEERTMKYPNGIIPGQESREQLTFRSIEGIGMVRDRFVNQNVIIVTHGGVINSILSKLSNGEIGSGKTILKNACINQISYKNESWVIDSYNSIKHLKPLLV